MKRRLWAAILVCSMAAGLTGAFTTHHSGSAMAAAHRVVVAPDGSCEKPSCLHPNG